MEPLCRELYCGTTACIESCPTGLQHRKLSYGTIVSYNYVCPIQPINVNIESCPNGIIVLHPIIIMTTVPLYMQRAEVRMYV